MSIQFTSTRFPKRRRGNRKSSSQISNKNREKKPFNDVTILAGNDETEIPANRMVLSCYCPFFEKMFRSGLKEQFEHVVQVKGVEGKIMKTIIDFLYTGNITISEENVADLVPALDYLLLEEPKEFCFTFFKSILSPQNSLYILHAANLYRSSYAFMLEIYKVINTNFTEVAKTDDFFAMSSEMLLAYLPRIDRVLVHETLLCQALINWTNYDKISRQTKFHKLLQQLVIFDRLSPQFLSKTLRKEKLVKKNAECCKIIAAASEKKKLIKARSYKKPKAILCLGAVKTPTKVADVFNLTGKTLLTYPDLPESLSEIHAMKLKNVVYCIGKILYGQLQKNIQRPGRLMLSKIDYSIVNKVYRMNFKDGILKWEELAPFSPVRGSFSAAAYDGLLVICGGRNAYNSVMKSVEVFHDDLCAWRRISPMNEAREQHELVACAGSLYALGGYNSISALSAVECLNSSCLGEEWKRVRPMQNARYLFAGVNCNNHIYAIGGSDGACNSSKPPSAKSVEKYNPVTNQWVYVSNMNTARTHHSACVINDCIYVIGGFDEKSNLIQDIECYDPATDKWTIIGKTNDVLANHAAIAV